MLKTLFMFGGRVNRLQYFLAGVIAHLLGAAVWASGLLSVGPTVGPEDVLPLLPLALVVLWVGLSLQAARIRDIGLSPLLVIFTLAILFLLLDFGQRSAEGTELQSTLSVVSIGLQILAGLFLMLMPGDGFAQDDPAVSLPASKTLSSRTSSGRIEPSRLAHPPSKRPSRPETPPSVIAASKSQTGARPSFGRRGL